MMEADAFACKLEDGLDLLQLLVFGPDICQVTGKHLIDLLSLGRSGEFRPHHGEALGELLAIVATEEEVDGGKQVFFLQCVHDFVGLGLIAGFALPATRFAGLATMATSFAADIGEIGDLLAPVVDDFCQGVLMEVIERKRHRALVVDDEADRTVRTADPASDFAGIGDGGGKANELDVIRAENDRFFPGGASFGVGEVMDLVEDHRFDIVQLPWALEQHITEDFRRHDDDAGVPVFGNVASEEPDLVAVDGPEVAEFLIRECLDRCGVDNAAGAFERVVDAELRDDGFAGAGGGSDHDGIAPQQDGDSFPLECVQREVIHGAELVDGAFDILPGSSGCREHIGVQGG